MSSTSDGTTSSCTSAPSRLMKFTVRDSSSVPSKVVIQNKIKLVNFSKTIGDVIISVVEENIEASTPLTADLISEVKVEDNDLSDCLASTIMDISEVIDASTISKSGWYIKMNLSNSKRSTSENQGPKKCAFSVMLENANATNFLDYKEILFPFLPHQVNCGATVSEHEETLRHLHSENIQKQTKALLRTVLYQYDFGYKDNSERKALNSFVNTYSNVLCFICNFWYSLFRPYNFPQMPTADRYTKSISLQLLTLTDSKKKASSIPLDSRKITQHIDALEHLSVPFLCSPNKTKKKIAKFIHHDIRKNILSLLNDTKIRLFEQSARSRKNKADIRIPALLKQKEDPEPCFQIYDPMSETPTGSGISLNCIRKLCQELSAKHEYVPHVITDEFSGLDDPKYDKTRREYRRKIKQKISEGSCHPFSVCLHTYSVGGCRPDLLTVFKVPSKYKRQSDDIVHTQKVVSAIKECEQVAFNAEVLQTTNEMFRLMRTYAGIRVDKRVMSNLRDIISGGASTFESSALDTLLLSGSFDQNVIQDMRYLNSYRGRGNGTTDFSVFYNKCSLILRSTAGAQERRRADATDTLYGPTVRSIPNLKEKAIKALHEDIAAGKIDKMPPIPSLESIRLQFVPNNPVAAASGKLTGRLGVVRKMQMRTLRAEHPDQHWVNAFTKNHKEWVIELKRIVDTLVIFAGQDDKATIDVGDLVPVSTNVRARNKAIVPVDGTCMVKAADHDFSKAKIIPSVTLICNIPDEYGGSFYSGGPNGQGVIHVTLHDAIFEPSDVFHHSAQLCDIIKNREKMPYALLNQSDGGCDHNIKFLRTQLALVGLFLVLDIDHLVAIRGAPHGSWINVAERAMSLLNLGLEGLALRRGQMSPWAEEAVKNIATMKGLRDLVHQMGLEEKAISRSRKRSRTEVELSIQGTQYKEHNKRVRTDCSETLLSSKSTPMTPSQSKTVTSSGSTAITQNVRPMPQSQQLLGSDPTPPTNQVMCSYGTINKCICGGTPVVLVPCSRPGCSKSLHHLCQTEFANTNKLQELEGPEKKVCNLHLSDMYNVGVLARFDPRFEAHTMQAIARSSNPTPSLNDRPCGFPDSTQMKELISKSLLDPCQSKIAPTKLKPRTGRDLKQEWNDSMTLPISQVADRFGELELDGRPVKVDPPCKEEQVDELHKALKDIDPLYDPAIREMSRFKKKMPTLHKFFQDHTISTPYSFSIQKCGKVDCSHCKPICSPIGPVRDLVMQRQPTPIVNNNRPGHFLSRRELLQADVRADNEKLTDLSCLPSKKPNDPDHLKERKKLDTANGKKIKGWPNTAVRRSVACWECARPRCLFSRMKLSLEQEEALDTCIELNQYVCGHRLFPDTHSLAEVVYQRVGITCSDNVEKEYYNPEGNKRLFFVTPMICSHCASAKDVMSQKEIDDEKISDGFRCLPICRGCVDNGQKPTKRSNRSRQNLMKKKTEENARKELAQMEKRHQQN